MRLYFYVYKCHVSCFVFSFYLVGDFIPGSAVLVFDIHVIDFHNPKDPVNIKVTHKPQECNMRSEADDLIQYRYNCSLMDGTLLYTSWAPSAVHSATLHPPPHACNHCWLLVWQISVGLEFIPSLSLWQKHVCLHGSRFFFFSFLNVLC